MWTEANRLNDFDLVFGRLKELWKPYEDGLDIVENSEGSFSVEWPRKHSKKTEDFVGAVRVNKNYVSFHLMAVYTRIRAWLRPSRRSCKNACRENHVSTSARSTKVYSLNWRNSWRGR